MEEEQLEELEALSSIFEQDYLDAEKADALDATEIDRSRPHFALNLFPAGEDENSSFVAVRLHVSFPPDYPDAKPIFKVIPTKGEEALAPLLSELTTALEEEAEESIGGPMCFTLAERAREWLEEHNEDPEEQSLHAKMMRREKELAEARGGGEGVKEGDDGKGKGKYSAGALESVDRADSEPVTRESFLAWRTKFDEEMEKTTNGGRSCGDVRLDSGGAKGAKKKGGKSGRQEQKERKEAKERASRLTGRQVFEKNRGMVTSDETFLEEALQRAVERQGSQEDGNERDGGGASGGKGRGVSVNESLFEGEDFDDLDDSSDEEDG